MKEGLLLRCLAEVAVGRCRIGSIDSIRTSRLREEWRKTKRGLDFAIKFFRECAGIETAEALPSTLLIVPIMRLAVINGYAFSVEAILKTLSWLCTSIIQGRYSGRAAEAALDCDLAVMRDSADPLADMIKAALGRAGRTDAVAAKDLEGSTWRSPLLGMMYLAAKKRGAVDWGTGLPLGIDGERGGGLKALRTRIFSVKAVVDALGPVHGKAKARRLADDLANYVFRSDRAAGAAPDEYLPRILDRWGRAALDSQCIPLDRSLWAIDRCEDFLAARRKAIAGRISELLLPPPAQECLAAIQAGETAAVEFKSSMLYDYRTGQRNPHLRYVLTKGVCAFMNTDGGTIYVGVADDSAVLGIEADYGILGGHQNWDGWLQALAGALKEIDVPGVPRMSHEAVEIGGRTVAKITVERGDEPAWLGPPENRKLAIRDGTTSRLLDAKDAAAYVRRRFPGWAVGAP